MKTLKKLLGFKENYPYSSATECITQTVEYQGNKVMWGLNEKGHPPLLIYPRPSIRVKMNYKDCPIEFGNLPEDYNGDVYLNESHDIAMSRCIKTENAEKIIEAMFNNNMVFEYDETK